MGGNGMPSLLNDPALRALAQGWADNPDLYTEVGTASRLAVIWWQTSA